MDITKRLYQVDGQALPRPNLLSFNRNTFDPTTLKFTDSVGANERTLYPLQYIQADGTGYFVNSAMVTAGRTITSTTKNGTTTLSSPSAGRLNAATGTLWDFTVTWSDAVVSSYAYCSLVTATYAVCFDRSGNGRHLVATGFSDLSTVCVSGRSFGSDVLQTAGWSAGGLGPEIVVNGGFDADTGWIKGSGWEITSNAARKTNTTAASLQQNIFVGGVPYRFSFNIISRNNVGIIGIGGSFHAGGYYPSGTGVKTVDFTAAGTGGGIYSTEICVIDDVSCKLLIPSTVPIPAQTANPSLDALGNALTYPGRAKYSIVPKGRTGNCATLASETSIAITGVTGATVLSKEGTGTVTIGTNVINRATDGTLYNLKLTLSNGRVLTLPLTEGSGTTIYAYDSTGQNYTGTITTSDINAFWAGKQTTYYPGLQYGYRLSGSTYIPANPYTPGLACDGNALTYLPGRLNPSSLYSMPDAQQCRDALDHTAGTASVFYDSNNVPTEVSLYTLREAAVGPNLFLNPDNENKGIALYSTDRTAAEEIKLWKLLGSQYALPTPTAFFNGVDTTGMTSYAGGAATFSDVDGKLRISPANTMARTGMRYEGGVYYDTTASGVPIVTSTDQVTRTSATSLTGEALGPELVTNGTFETDTGWTKGTGWTVDTTNKEADKSAGSASDLYQNCGLAVNKKYRVSYEVKNYVAGQVRIVMNGGSGTYRLANGTFTEDLTHGATPDPFIYFNTSSTFNGSIDNVSVKEILPTWTNVFTNNSPVKRYSITNPLTMPGFLCEPARTNKCTCVKANPTATTNISKIGGDANTTLTVVNDNDALVAAGLDKICTSGMVYELDNTGGASTAYAQIQGTVANTNPHSLSVYARKLSGANITRIELNSEQGRVEFTSSTYARVLSQNITPDNSSRILMITCQAGCKARFILPNLEEGAFATSPICHLDTTAAEQRNASVLTYPTAGKIRSNNMAFLVTIIPKGITSAEEHIFGTRYDGNNGLSIIINSGRIWFRKAISGTTYNAETVTTYTNGVPVQFLAVQSSAGMFCCSRTYTSGWGGWTNGTSDTTGSGKANFSMGANYYVGSNGAGAIQFTGNISLFDAIPIPAGVSDPLAWAKNQWNIT